MHIAITGHTAGIGLAFARYLEARNHHIVGLSRREGNNIRNIPKTVEKIVPCDMWINNAQSGYAQTELLYQVAEIWCDDSSKMIWNISTMMTQNTALPIIDGIDPSVLVQYRNQKRALEDAHHSLKHHKMRMCLIRPGAVATQSRNQAGIDAADVDAWVAAVCDFYTRCRAHNLWPQEISLGFRPEAPDI